MTIRFVTLLAAAILLSACTEQDWQHALTYTGMDGSQEAASQAQPAAAATAATAPAPLAQAAAAAAEAAPIPEGAQPAPNAFCENVASQDARNNDFDPATQRRVFVQSYQQCVAVFGGVTK